MNQEKRIFGLDFLRFTAIVCVLLAHTVGLLSNGHISNNIVAFGAAFGVEFFFVLSGMLIGTIIIKTHIKEQTTTFSSVRFFWIRRWFRTLPNYYLMFTVLFVLSLVSKNPLPNMSSLKWASYFVFLQNAVSPELNNFFGVAWSLCIEEWFYLLFPLLLILMQVFFKKKPVSLLATIFIFIIVPLVGRSILSFNNNLEWDSCFRKMLFIRLDGIAIGVLAAFVNHYFIDFWKRNKNRLFILGVVLFIPLTVIYYNKFILTYDFVKNHNVADVGFFLKTAFFTLIDISIALFLPLLCALRVNTSNYLSRMITFISLISYSLYLLHTVVISILSHFLRNQSGIIIFIFSWVVSIIGSYIQYTYFEKNATSLRERFSNKKQVLQLPK